MYDEWLRLFWKGRFLLEIKVPNDPRFVIFGSKNCHKILENMKKGVYRLPKFIKNLPEWCPGALRKGFWKKVGKHVNANDSMLRHFGVTWAILVDFWGAREIQGGAKNGPKH